VDLCENHGGAAMLEPFHYLLEYPTDQLLHGLPLHPSLVWIKLIWPLTRQLSLAGHYLGCLLVRLR
jgi:hypothetical protein